jgi:hypothetical protein
MDKDLERYLDTLLTADKYSKSQITEVVNFLSLTSAADGIAVLERDKLEYFNSSISRILEIPESYVSTSFHFNLTHPVIISIISKFFATSNKPYYKDFFGPISKRKRTVKVLLKSLPIGRSKYMILVIKPVE